MILGALLAVSLKPQADCLNALYQQEVEKAKNISYCEQTWKSPVKQIILY